MKDINLYMVGGAVRDLIRGVQSKDIDFAVEADSFDHMREWLLRNNFVIFAETPKYFTLRARAPKDSFKFANMDLTSQTFDFTLCRTERDYTDGRHPDVVEMGTIYDDLSRRDFTMNAIAIAQDGSYIDPFDGQEDIRNETIRCVGSTDRLKEDGLRIFRALRFRIQLRFKYDVELDDFMEDWENAVYVHDLSMDRIRDELTKCFKVSGTGRVINHMHHYVHFFAEAYSRGLWLKPTTEKK